MEKFQAKPKTAELLPVSVEVEAGKDGQDVWRIKVKGEKIYSIIWDGGTQICVKKM